MYFYIEFGYVKLNYVFYLNFILGLLKSRKEKREREKKERVKRKEEGVIYFYFFEFVDEFFVL